MLKRILLPIIIILAFVSCGDDDAMHERLDYLSSCNRQDTVFSERWLPMADSLVTYFDHRGSANERLMAHYLKGRVFHDMGEAPRAIDSYHNAIACADTTDTNCDIRTLGCVYAQMADVYHKVLLLSDAVSSWREAMHYAYVINDTVCWLYDYVMIGNDYLLMNRTDSAEIILKDALSKYQRYGRDDLAIHVLWSLMHLYSGIAEKSEELKQIISDIEFSKLPYDDNNELHPSFRQFYYYKGRYFEIVEQLDSAEYYYRKVYRPNMKPHENDPMYRGLLSVFKKRHQADSIAKYAQLFCEANDSSIAISDRELTARLAASYRYNTIQREALEHEHEANRAHVILIIVVALVVFIAVITALLWSRFKEKKEREMEAFRKEYANAVDTYQHNLESLRIIDETRKTTIGVMQSKMLTIEHELREENEQLKEKLSKMREQSNIQKSIKRTQDYFNSQIVQHIYALEEKPLVKLNKADKEKLLRTTREYFPSLIKDLNQAEGITQQALYTAILVSLNVHSSGISNLLDISSQQVANLKRVVNTALFNDSSARTLYTNLIQHYEIFVN